MKDRVVRREIRVRDPKGNQLASMLLQVIERDASGRPTACRLMHDDETLDVARAKALPACVRFATMDAYAFDGLDAHCRFDAAFAGFWWSHVPLRRLGPWLQALHAHLAPGARVVFIDNSFVPASSTPIDRRDAEGNTYQRRTLDDGSVHEVLKNFPTFEQARALLGPRARQARWNEIGHPLAHYWVLEYELA